jgi:hypothetical protein
MHTSSLPKEEFESSLAKLIESVLFGKAHVVIGRGLSAKVMADPVIAHTAPTFWGMTIYAHFDMAQLIAFKLFDEQRNALTIEYLLDRAAEHPEVFPKGTAEQVAAIVGIAREQISNLSIHLIPIRAKRNRIIAHADSTIVRDPERLAKDTQVTFSNLNAIFETAAGALNEISVAYRDVSPLWPLLGDDDFEVAVQLIVDAKHAQVDQYEKEFGPPAPFQRPTSQRSRIF